MSHDDYNYKAINLMIKNKILTSRDCLYKILLSIVTSTSLFLTILIRNLLAVMIHKGRSPHVTLENDNKINMEEISKL